MRIVVQNQKGGVGKTTTARNLASALLHLSLARSVVLADLDPQAHLTQMLPQSDLSSEADVTDWLSGEIVHAAQVRGEPGLRLLRSGVHVTPPSTGPVMPVGADWVIVDTAPGWSDLTVTLCGWADLVLCPLEPDFLGLSGVARLCERFTEQGLALDKLRFLLSRHSSRLKLHRDVQARLFERFGTSQLLPVTISNSVRISESAGFGRSIISHAPRSASAAEFLALAGLLAGSSPPEPERSVA